MGRWHAAIHTRWHFCGNVSLYIFQLVEHLIHRRFQCFGYQSPLFSRETPFEHPHAVTISKPGEFTLRMANVFYFHRFDPFRPTVSADQPLDMRCGAVAGDHQQILLVLPGRHPGHGPDLGVRNAAVAKRSRNLRQFGQCM